MYYSVILLTAAVAVFGLVMPVVRGTSARDLKHFKNSIWYIVYITFLLGMTYVGSDGALTLVSFNIATLIVAVVSVLVFYPLDVISGLSQRLTVADYMAE